MQWFEEPNKTFPKWPCHVLVTESSEPLRPAFVDFWKRVLTDGYRLPRGSRTRLAIEMLPRRISADKIGKVRAVFHSSLRSQSEGIGIYLLRSDVFACMQADDENDLDFEKRELVWMLGQYAALKEAVRDPQTWPLFEKINSSQPLAVDAGTGNGWFAMQLGQEGFGVLPENDQRLLADKETVPDDPLQSLAGGVIDVPWMRLMEELCAAIIQYTPPHFKNIHCKITQRLEQGQRALFYDIRCPEFPDEGTTEPNARLHTAATRAVQHLSAEQGLFKGIVVQLNIQKDGTWLHSSKQI
jgi:hypothetical protein